MLIHASDEHANRYRCEQRGERFGIMFPAVGDKADCAERQSERACSFGWIRREIFWLKTNPTGLKY